MGRFKPVIALALVVSLVYLGFVQYSFGGEYQASQAREDVVTTATPLPKADPSHLLSQVPKSSDEHQSTELSKPTSEDKPDKNKAPNAIPGQKITKKKGQWWKWVRGALIVVGVGYLIYKLITKKSEKSKPPVEQDYKTNLVFRVFNHTQEEIKTYTLENIMTSSSVTINISDLGVTGVDPNRMAIRGPVDNCIYVSFTKNGTATFTVERWRNELFNGNYTIFLMNSSNNANYNLIDTNMNGGKLNVGAAIKYVRGPDLIEGPEYLIQNDQKTGAVDQLAKAITYPWMTYGSFTKVDSGQNLKVYYSNEWTGGMHGLDNNGMFFASQNTINSVDSSILATWIAEIFEVTTATDDLGGESSQMTITNIYYADGNLNGVGKDFFAYVFVKDQNKIGQ